MKKRIVKKDVGAAEIILRIIPKPTYNIIKKKSDIAGVRKRLLKTMEPVKIGVAEVIGLGAGVKRFLLKNSQS